jgi:hypothetical protein
MSSAGLDETRARCLRGVPGVVFGLFGRLSTGVGQENEDFTPKICDSA